MTATSRSTDAAVRPETAAARGRLEEPLDRFPPRHIGPSDDEIAEMLRDLGFDTLDALGEAVVPADIRLRRRLDLPEARGERELLAHLRTIAARNQVFRSYIGMGYHGCITPPVIQR